MEWPNTIPGPCQMQVIASGAADPKRLIRSSRSYQFRRGRIDQYQLGYSFTAAQYADFLTFYRDLGKGASFFEVELFDGNEYVTQSIRIIKVPTITDDYPRKNVEFTAEVFARAIVSIDDLDEYITGSPSLPPGLRFGLSLSESGGLRFGVMQR